MLEPAQLYEGVLKEKFCRIAYDPFYMYSQSGYADEYTSSKSNWSKHEFVSLDSNGKIIGYIGYDVYQKDRTAEGMVAINFTGSVEFGGDLLKAIDDIFCKYNFRKLCFSVYIGNPIEDTYDRLVNTYGGYIVGVKKKHTRLLDGNFHDLKMYEIFRDKYIANRPSRFKQAN